MFSESARKGQSYLSILGFSIRVSWIGDTCRELFGRFLFLGKGEKRSLRHHLGSCFWVGVTPLSALAVDGLELHVAEEGVSHEITALPCGWNLQNEGGVWWDEAWEALGTVGVVTVSLSESRVFRACDDGFTYPVIVRVAFSPSDMPPSWLTTPSSQPARSD